MCGIFGVRRSWLARQTGDAKASLSLALDALRWRGRDEARIVLHGDFAIGCARLAISDRRSSQPVSRRDGRWVAALNGAVTNARALWADALPVALSRRALPNDAWLPLVLVQARGPAALADLRGHHVCVVADAARDEWHVSRDPFGEKPLFVLRERGEPVAFASTMPALRALGAPFTLSSEATQRFFRDGALGALLHRSADIEVADEQRGFGIPVVADTRPSAQPMPFAAALQSAVARCADVDAELGMFLSGGIDSSCLAAELGAQQRRVRAYQFLAKGEPSDERELAAHVAARFGHELVCVDAGTETLDALPMLTSQWGLPLGDPSVLAAYAVARAAAADGIRVMLSGEGSDELMFGYARHRALLRMPNVRMRLPFVSSWSMGTTSRALRAIAAEDPYAALLEVTPPAFWSDALSIDGGAQDALVSGVGARGARDERLRHAASVDRDFYLRSDLLPKLDVATMAAQVEGRCPFLDGDVAHALDAMSPMQRLGKAPLRSVYATKLPHAVFAQRKRGFALPLDRWFRGELTMLDLLRDQRTRQRAHLRATGLDRAIDLHRSRRADLGRALYLVAAFEIWLRTEDARCA